MTKGEVFLGFMERLVDTADRVFDRLRPNVLTIAVLVTFLIHDFGNRLIQELKLTDVPPEVLIALVTGLIFTGIGGLIACMMRMFESPSIPADVHERMTREMREMIREMFLHLSEAKPK